MTVPAVHCEARKVSYRQTKDGLVVAFVIHPNDMPDALAVAPLGQRYMLALAAIGDDEQPLAPAPEPQRGDPLRSERAKESYRQSSAAEQAVVRAALLPKDERFCAWVANEKADGGARRVYGVSQSEAEHYIRKRCCGGKSRSLIAEVPEYLDRFLAMETEYLIDVGQMAAPR